MSSSNIVQFRLFLSSPRPKKYSHFIYSNRWNLENPMAIHGEPSPWIKKPEFVGPRLDFEDSLYEHYGFVELPVNFSLDDDIAKRSEELILEMYSKTLALLRRHHAALLKTVKVCLSTLQSHNSYLKEGFILYLIFYLLPSTSSAHNEYRTCSLI